MAEFEYPKCNLCGSKKNKEFLSKITSWEYKGIFNLVKCGHCGFVFLSPRPKKTSISNYYPEEGYWNMKSDKDWKKIRDNKYKILYSLIFKSEEKSSILDIGSGNGVFLSKFVEKGWIVSCVEFSKYASNFSKKNFAIDTFCGDLLQYKTSNKYNFITFNNSLEHLYFPFESLKKANELLNKGGTLFVTVPNIESLGFKIFRRSWYPLQVPRHLSHFSVKTLSKILRKSGFKNLKVNYGYYEHNYHGFYESFRLLFSPRFKKAESGGLQNEEINQKKNFIKEFGKLIDKILSPIFAKLGQIFKRSETIIITAEK